MDRPVIDRPVIDLRRPERRHRLNSSSQRRAERTGSLLLLASMIEPAARFSDLCIPPSD
jgi:hypothetical protein